MQDGLNCRPETERTCPKSTSKSQNTTYRKLSQCYEQFPHRIHEAAKISSIPSSYHFGHIPTTNPVTAFQYDSCPSFPTRQPYPRVQSAYPQHSTVPSPPQDECANTLHPHQLSGHCVNTSQANLNTRHILHYSAHASNTFPNPANQGPHKCPTSGVHVPATPQGY